MVSYISFAINAVQSWRVLILVVVEDGLVLYNGVEHIEFAMLS